MVRTYTVNYSASKRNLRTDSKDFIITGETEDDFIVNLLNAVKDDKTIGEIYEIIVEEA